MTYKNISSGRQLSFDELFGDGLADAHFSIDDSFPEQFANDLSQREVFNKHLFRPNTYLHKWWARRCGSTFRTILKQFVSQEQSHDFYAPGGLEGKIVLDPMMGGGTTLHEAIRLGANVIGADIDPIPIVQARTSLSAAKLRDLQIAFHQFFRDLHQPLAFYFQTECPYCAQTLEAQFILHGLRKRCACGEVVQIEQPELRQETNQTICISPENWEITGQPPPPQQVVQNRRLLTKIEKECPGCGQAYQECLDVPYYARYVPFAIAAACPQHGFFFRSPGEKDLARIQQVDEQRKNLDFGKTEDFTVHPGPKSDDLLRHNIGSYLDVFSSRQLLYLHQAIEQLRKYDGVAKLNLGILVSTSLEFNSLLCGYKGWYKRRPGAIRHVFALHAYSLPYTALENNPVNRESSSGNLQQLFRDRVERGRKWALAPIERKLRPDGTQQLIKVHGETDSGIEVFDQSSLRSDRQRFWLIHGDSRRLPLDDHSIDLIVTDPPYYDSVQYSNLAAFFRVWLARLLPDEVNWTYDETHSAVAVKTTADLSRFMTILSGIFAECGRVLRPGNGRLVFTFHHWDAQAWAELTLALQHAHFRLMNAYVVFSEHPISVHINNLHSITHDCILVCALHPHTPTVCWSLLESIDTADSEAFCRQCSHALGWFLEQAYAESEIRQRWKELINGRNVNGSQYR